MNIVYKTEIPPINDYFKLFETSGWNKKYRLTKEEMFQTIKKTHLVVAAYDGDNLVGIGRLITDGVIHAMIYDMIISPDYQGKGIGTRILDMILAKCFNENIRDIQLFCAKGKKNFYKKNGFNERDNEAPGMEYTGNRPN